MKITPKLSMIMLLNALPVTPMVQAMSICQGSFTLQSLSHGFTTRTTEPVKTLVVTLMNGVNSNDADSLLETRRKISDLYLGLDPANPGVNDGSQFQDVIESFAQGASLLKTDADPKTSAERSDSEELAETVVLQRLLEEQMKILAEVVTYLKAADMDPDSNSPKIEHRDVKFKNLDENLINVRSFMNTLIALQAQAIRERSNGTSMTPVQKVPDSVIKMIRVMVEDFADLKARSQLRFSEKVRLEKERIYLLGNGSPSASRFTSETFAKIIEEQGLDSKTINAEESLTILMRIQDEQLDRVRRVAQQDIEVNADLDVEKVAFEIEIQFSMILAQKRILDSENPEIAQLQEGIRGYLAIENLITILIKNNLVEKNSDGTFVVKQGVDLNLGKYRHFDLMALITQKDIEQDEKIEKIQTAQRNSKAWEATIKKVVVGGWALSQVPASYSLDTITMDIPGGKRSFNVDEINKMVKLLSSITPDPVGGLRRP